MVGIEKTLATIGDLQKLAVDGIKLAKSGPFGLGLFTGVLKVVGDIKDLVTDAPFALPELKDLDGAESAQLGAAAYGLVTAVIGAVVV